MTDQLHLDVIDPAARADQVAGSVTARSEQGVVASILPAPTGHPSPAGGTDGDAAPATQMGVRSAPHPLVVGLDLSLVATGVALMRPAGLMSTQTVKVKGDGIVRLRRIVAAISEQVLACRPALVVVEGPSYGSVGRGTHERAGLFWLVMNALWENSTPVGVAPPSNIKKYALGVGGGPRATKDAVLLAASRRFPDFEGDNNAADATFAALMGVDHLTGQSVVPAAHRVALAGCAWPTVPRAS